MKHLHLIEDCHLQKSLDYGVILFVLEYCWCVVRLKFKPFFCYGLSCSCPHWKYLVVVVFCAHVRYFVLQNNKQTCKYKTHSNLTKSPQSLFRQEPTIGKWVLFFIHHCSGLNYHAFACDSKFYKIAGSCLTCNHIVQ